MSELSVDSASALSNASHGMPSATYIPQYSPPRSPKTYPPQSPSSYGHVYSPPRRYSNTKQHSPLGTSYENRNSGHYREPKRVIGCAIPRVVGFCGVDNSVDPWLLAIISRAYPWIEWGILFRPDMEGNFSCTIYWTSRLTNKTCKIYFRTTSVPNLRLGRSFFGDHGTRISNSQMCRTSLWKVVFL